MKKYQLWLQRKTYTQHLSNLVRIKMTTSERSLVTKAVPLLQKPKNLMRYQSQTKINSTMSGHDLSYILTTRQLQHHKLRLVRSKQIVRENEQMVKRINQTRPFVANNRPIDYSNYKLKRRMQRTNEQHSFEQKHKNYQEFIKMREEKRSAHHRYQLTLTFQNVDLRVPQHPFTEVTLEILAPQSIGRSEFVKPDALEDRTFQFTFPQQLPDFFTLRLHSYKGLEHTVLGDFVIARPEQGATVGGEWPTAGMCGALTGKITYTRLLPKFWSIKRFKV